MAGQCGEFVRIGDGDLVRAGVHIRDVNRTAHVVNGRHRIDRAAVLDLVDDLVYDAGRDYRAVRTLGQIVRAVGNLASDV